MSSACSPATRASPARSRRIASTSRNRPVTRRQARSQPPARGRPSEAASQRTGGNVSPRRPTMRKRHADGTRDAMLPPVCVMPSIRLRDAYLSRRQPCASLSIVMPNAPIAGRRQVASRRVSPCVPSAMRSHASDASHALRRHGDGMPPASRGVTGRCERRQRRAGMVTA